MRYVARTARGPIAVEVSRRGTGRYSVRIEGRVREVEARRDGASVLLVVDGRPLEAVVAREAVADGSAGGRAYGVSIGGRLYPVVLADALRGAGPAAALRRDGPAEVRAYMPGRIAAVLVSEGQEVAEGQGVLVVEAMKMENELPAPRAGRVTTLRVRPGEAVETGAPLFTVE